MIRLTVSFSLQQGAPKSCRTSARRGIPFIRLIKRVLLAFVILPLYIVSPTLLAEPHQAEQVEPVGTTAVAESVKESPVNSSADKKKAMHHPRGDLEGSYGFNTPAQPDFWIAAGFTGFIIGLFITTFIYFKPSRAR